MEELSTVSDSNATPIHVLVVDDYLMDRKIVEKLLKTASFKVTTADSGKKAIEVLGLKEKQVENGSNNDHRIDIILTDYCMPGMDGYDLLMAVKEHIHMKLIPVVIMSSQYNPQRISRCVTNGAEEFLQKPLQPKDLQKLRSYVRPVAVPKTGTKRKVLIDLVPQCDATERRPHLAGVAVA